ncbi:MAG TPA: Flp pilus assembly protein CpaB [Myxococcota bacterium]|nr:Flp pilus assembly protein CpaB [Myxococcota bacterium]
MASANIAYAFIGGAALAAIVATIGVVRLVESYQTPIDTAEKDVKTINVVVARRTLYQGVEISNDDLWVTSIPPEYLPQVTEAEDKKELKKAEVFKTRERVVGQVPRERILKNEIIRPERLADGTRGVGLNAFIARGMRAVSLDLRGADAITHFLAPGNYVDVLVTMEDELGNLRTEPLMQTVFIVGVNSRAENESDVDVDKRGKQKPSVTFMVTPEQAEQLAYAEELGDVSLALRNVQDTDYEQYKAYDINGVLRRIYQKAPVERATVASVRSVPQAAPKAEPAAAPPPSDGPTIDIIRGGMHMRVEAQDKPLIPGSDDGTNSKGARQQQPKR